MRYTRRNQNSGVSMPKVKILTEREPWIDGLPRKAGEVVDAPEELAKWLVEQGWAEAAEKPKKVTRDADA